MSEAQTFANIDQLFGTSLDDLADLPSFETPAPGSYILSVTLDVKKINGKDVVEAAYVVIEGVEAATSGVGVDASRALAVPGSKFSQIFMLDNEYGIGNLKKFLAPFAEHFGTQSIQQLVRDDVRDVQIAALVKNRKDKTDAERFYADVMNITIA